MKSARAGGRHAGRENARPAWHAGKHERCVLAAILLGLMLSAPFLVPYHRLPITSFYSEWLVFGMAALAVAALAASLPLRALAFPHSVLAPLLFGGVVIVQAVLDRFPFGEQAVTVGLYLALAAALMIAGATLKAHEEIASNPALAAWLAFFMLAGGALNALAGIVQWLPLADLFGPLVIRAPGRIVFGNLAQQNHFANQLALALGSLLFLAVGGRLRARWAIPLAAILLFAMALSGSRSTWIYLFGFVALTWIAFRAEPAGRKLIRAGLLLLAGYAIVHAILFLSPGASSDGSGQALERLANVASAVSPRTYLWSHALVMFAGAPVLGVGFDDFSHQMFLHWPLVYSYGVKELDNHAHNIVLQLLSLTGAAGFAAVAVPLLSWLRRQWAQPRTVETWWLWALLGVIGFHSLLEQPLWYAYFLAPAALLIGIADPRRLIWKFSGARKALVLALGCVGVAAAVKIAIDYDRLEGWIYDFRYARGATAQAQAEALRKLEANSLFAPFVRLGHPGIVVPDSAPAEDKLRLSERLMRFAPVPDVAYRHAVLLAAAGRLEESIAQLQRAAAVYPADLPLYAGRIRQLAGKDPAVYRALSFEAEALARTYARPGPVP